MRSLRPLCLRQIGIKMTNNISLFTGSIIDGRGRATGDLKNLDDIVQKKLEPGSLNLVLSEPILLSNHYIDFIFDKENRFLWSIVIDGYTIPVYIYRWNGTPMHIVELVSTENLRRYCNLEDNKLTIMIDNIKIKRVPFFSRLCWYLLWWRRENWYYSKDAYKIFISKYLKIMYVMTSQRNNGIFSLLKNSLQKNNSKNI